ncbi:MAG: 16S rRNA (cytosine(967)-C(5))-methyltransferase RsmB [Burkholderiales bacterium]
MRRGVALPQALTLLPELPSNTRGAVQDLSYRAMRFRGTGDALIRLLAQQAPPPFWHEMLVLAFSLLASPDYAPYAVVDQTVEAISRDKKGSAAAGKFVNALLRRYLREQSHWQQQLAHEAEAVWNYPDWWIRRLQSDYPQHWQHILRAGNALPPMTLRVNVRQQSRQHYLEQLHAAGIQALASSVAGSAVVLERPVPVQHLPGFASGAVSVQDAAAQLAAPLLDLQAGQQVLDACAAPGGKTAHILESVDCELLALDHDEQRLQRVSDNLQRLQLSGQCRAGDAARPEGWAQGRHFDRILADVPCTASGIVRRHADIRWLRRESDIVQLATSAERILDALWSRLKPGGKLLLATCSVFPREGEQQARRFVQRHTDAVALPAPAQMLPDDDSYLAHLEHADSSIPDRLASTHDGFFYAVLEKRA